MSSSEQKKFNKYDKGKFSKPVSRKERGLIKQEERSRYLQARNNIEKWIESLLSVAPFDSNDPIREIQERCFTANVEGEERNKEQYMSKNKCEISANNLLPNRLWERKNSGLSGSLISVEDCSVSTINNIDRINKTCKLQLVQEEEDQRLSSTGVHNSVEDLNTGILESFEGNATILTLEAIEVEQMAQNTKVFENFKRLQLLNPRKMDRIKAPPPIDESQFETETDQAKMFTMVTTLNDICLKLAELDIRQHHETDRVDTRLTSIQTQVDNTTINVDRILKENGVLKGLVQRQFMQIRELEDKVTYLSAKSMENNVTISGILEGDKKGKENCLEKVTKFLRECVEIDVAEEEILVAHRIGKLNIKAKKPRLVVVRCMPRLKERILQNSKNLKDKTNADGDSYYINKQLPEKMQMQNLEIRKTIKAQKDKEDGYATKDKTNIEVRSKTVYFNGEPARQALPPPTPMDLFPDATEKDKWDKIKLASSDLESVQNSDFQAYAFKTNQILEVKRVYAKVRQLHPAATHVIGVFSAKGKEAIQDDGEIDASFKLLQKVKEEISFNVAVFVVRVYGGKKLGPQHFETINEVALQAIKRIGK